MKTSGSEPSSQLTRAQLMAENTKLRREIDHRVRNSLQVVASLVDVTARSATEPSALAVLDILRARISAMIAVYRTLDDVPHRATVNMGDTLRDLVDQVADSRPTGTPRNEAQIEAENIILPLDDAMPVALMVIEVLLAAALQADADSTGPTAIVALTREGADARLRIHLVNATGDALMPLLTHHAQEMIEALARQLGGPLIVDNDEGVSRTIEVRFPVRNLARTHE